MKILVSHCFLGENCKYNGGNNYNAELLSVLKNHELIPVCPETFGGLKSPRLPAEIVGDKVLFSDGSDATEAFTKGAEKTLEIAKAQGVKVAVLKANSPSCGSGIIYDGTFTGKKVNGYGVAAKLLTENGIKVYSEQDIEEIKKL